VERVALALDAALISTPENIFYLTGLDHWGYFAPHILIVPADGELVLVTRAMERVSIETYVRNARFEGHADTETAADLAVRILRGRFAAPARLGLEHWSAGLSFGFGRALGAGLADVDWHDMTGLVDAMRLVKSPAEQALMRQAAGVTDAAVAAAMAAIGAGADEREVAAECHAAMIRAGGDTPGFGWIAGAVEAIEPSDPALKIPHMGWNALQAPLKPHALLAGISPGDYCYFVHSFALRADNADAVLAKTDYGGPVTAIVGRDNIVGTQFHPEKSQSAGLRLIANFLKWEP
jgi:Xaa-Pro dipeptidase